MMKTLQGKTALITGASSGLGADFARQLAELGCDLVLVARREDRLRELQAELTARFQVRVDCLALDLLDPVARQGLYDRLEKSGRIVDVLVNNAGLGVYGTFSETAWDHLAIMLELDVAALTHLTRLFVPDMVARGSGRILLIGSTGSFQPTPTYAAYAAAKAYVLSFGEALHYELRKTGVRCTVLCPGVTRTEFFQVSGQEMTTFQKATVMESADVARIGLRAMRKGRSCVVAGGINAFFAWGTRLLPRQALAAITARFMR